MRTRAGVAVVVVSTITLLTTLSLKPCFAEDTQSAAAGRGPVSSGSPSSSSPGKRLEFCQNEEFHAVCGSDSTSSVVVMTTARYGRMEINRCVQRNYGFIGCGIDRGDEVLAITDKMCSGRHNCTIRVPNAHLDEAAKRANCPDDFKSYLDVSYECVHVQAAPRHGCRPGGSPMPPIVAQSEGLLASVVTGESECGSHHSPWRLEVLPGQRLNFTLVDFSRQAVTAAGSAGGSATSHDDSSKMSAGGGSQSSSSTSTVCYAYAVFREGGIDGSAKTHTLCGSLVTGERESLAYTSTTEKVQVTVIAGRGQQTDAGRHFFLKYNVLGCGTPVAPSGGWVRRRGDLLTYGCNHTASTWTQICSDSKWTGPAYNCTVNENSSSLVAQGSASRLSFELAFVAVIFIALLIAGGILCIGVAWIRRQSRLYSSATTTNDKLQHCLELHAPLDGNTGTYEVRSTTAPYGPSFHPAIAGNIASDYCDSGVGGYGPITSAGFVARTPSDFYRTGSSSNDYAYIQETSTPPPVQTSIVPSSFGPRRNFSGVPVIPPQAGAAGNMFFAADGCRADAGFRAPYSTLERTDSVRTRQHFQQQQQPLMISPAHQRGQSSSSIGML